MKTPRGSATADDTSSLTSEATMTSGADEALTGTPFVWSETHNLILADASGAPVLQPAAWPAVQLKVSLQVPLIHCPRGFYPLGVLAERPYASRPQPLAPAWYT